jgi:UDP-GlcNAc3NAcA epimerase
MTVVGARPQFIKAAVVSRAIAKEPSLREIVVHTGQHYDENMSDVFFREMKISAPHYRLSVNNLSHGAMTGRMLEEIEALILKEQPESVMVYGDTNTTLAGALAAKKVQRRVIHVESGLRSFNMRMPEEINRILTDRISDVLFCPTDRSVHNLRSEGFERFGCSIVQSGDVMEDAALFYAEEASGTSRILDRENLAGKNYVLCTFHRAENTDDTDCLARIVSALNRIHREVPVVLPLHPRTRKIITTAGLPLAVHVLDPVGYLDMIQLTRNARLVLTDSGGLQKEAFFFNKFCIILREETEWQELVDHGYGRLAGTNECAILTAVHHFLDKTFKKDHQFYGGGVASATIARVLASST